MGDIGRRDFLKSAAVAAAGIGFAGTRSIFTGARADVDAPADDKPEQKPIPKRALGKTGFSSTLLGLGGESTVQQRGSREDAIEIVNRAIDLGVNYIDTSHIYGRGGSELNIGEVMRERRDEVFLATKSRERGDTPRAEQLFDQGCERLQTDKIDLYFFHAVDRDNDLNNILNRETGAIRFFERLREKERIRFIGISGHNYELFTRALDLYDFDCMLISINPAGISVSNMDHMARFFDKAQEKGVGVVAMKLAGKGAIFNGRNITMEQTMRYALSFPVSTAIVGITRLEQLVENVQLAKDFKPYSAEEIKQLEEEMRT